MKMTKAVAAFGGVLVLVCVLVAWEWYAQVGRGAAPVKPVQQIAAAPSAAPSPTATRAPVLYVPKPAVTRSPIPAVSPAQRPPVTARVQAVQAVPAEQPSTSPKPAASVAPYTASGGKVISNEPMVAATLGPHAISAQPLREQADAPPRILAMSLSTPIAHGGDVVSGTVETTSNVASVEARIAGFSSSMQKIGVGKFALSYRVPKLPFFLHRTYTIEVIARNSRGDAVTSSLPITIR